MKRSKWSNRSSRKYKVVSGWGLVVGGRFVNIGA
jgi:hypothetical protein